MNPNPPAIPEVLIEYKLSIRWPDSDEEDIEVYPTKESVEARITYLKTIPHCEGVKWKLI